MFYGRKMSHFGYARNKLGIVAFIDIIGEIVKFAVGIAQLGCERDRRFGVGGVAYQLDLDTCIVLSFEKISYITMYECLSRVMRR